MQVYMRLAWKIMNEVEDGGTGQSIIDFAIRLTSNIAGARTCAAGGEFVTEGR